MSPLSPRSTFRLAAGKIDWVASNTVNFHGVGSIGRANLDGWHGNIARANLDRTARDDHFT